MSTSRPDAAPPSQRPLRISHPHPTWELSVAEVRASLAWVLDQVRERDVVVTWHGRPVARITHPQRFDRLRPRRPAPNRRKVPS